MDVGRCWWLSSAHVVEVASMTSVLEEPAAVGDSAAPPDQRFRWRKNRVLAFGLVLVALGVGVALWVLLPGFIAIRGTGVLLDAKPFVCQSAADVTTYNAGDGFDTSQALFVPAIRLRPGLNCTMTVVIRNDSDADVAVDSITLPLAGPANGIGVHADRAQTQGIGPSGGRDDTDATFDYAHNPDSGGAFSVAAHSLQDSFRANLLHKA